VACGEVHVAAHGTQHAGWLHAAARLTFFVPPPARYVGLPRDGRAWKVKAGQVFRITCIEGPQVADVNFWNLHNPKVRAQWRRVCC
jgi:uncharacterized protein YcgI (DUF1989 family)